MLNFTKNQFILLGVFGVCCVTLLTPWIHGNDGAGYYAPTRSIVVDFDLDLKNELEYFKKDRKLNSIRLDKNTAKYYSQYPVGTSLVWIPGMTIAHIISKVFGLTSNGYTTLYFWLICFSSSILAFLSLWKCHENLVKRYGESIAFWSVTGVWLGSSLFYYMFFEASMSHAISFAVISYYLLKCWDVAENESLQLRDWMILGLLLGFILIIRLQDGILGLIPFCILVNQFWHSPGKLLLYVKTGLVFLGCLLIGLSPDLVVNFLHNDRWFAYGSEYYGGGFNSNQWYYGLKVMFSSNHGIFFWSPTLFLGLVGLRYRWKNPFVFSLLLVLFIQVFLTGFWSFWNGAQSFGHRFFVGYSFIFMIGIAELFHYILIKKLYLKYILILLLVLNFILMVQYGLRMIETEGPLDIVEFFRNFSEFPGMVRKALEFIGGKDAFL